MVVNIQILSLEYSMCTPQALFDDRKCWFFANRQIDLVPIMHVYGTVQETKQKACLHVHQLYPYFMLSFPHELFSSSNSNNNQNDNSNNSNEDDSDDLTSIYQNMDMKKVNQFISILGATIEDTFHQSLFGHSLNQYERTLKNQQQQQQPPSFHIHPRQFVHDIVLVSGKPFYGYWFNNKLFLKVYVYNPSHVGKMAAMFGNGTVMGHRFAVYEAHIPFPLQFMMDYNLFGMGDLTVEKLFFRLPFHSFRDLAADKISSQNAIQYGTILPDTVKRLSKCEIEMDTFSRDVMNRKDIVDLQHSLEDEKEESFGKERKLIRSLNVVWEEERRRRRSLEKASQPFIPFSPFERQEKRPQNELEGYMYDNLMKIVENMNKDDNENTKEPPAQEQDESLILTSQLPKAFSQKSSSTPQQQESNLKKSQEELNDFLSKFPTAFQTYEEIKQVYLANRDNSFYGQGNTLFNIQLTQGDSELENVLNWMRDKDFELKEDEYNNLGDCQEDEEDNEEESEDSLIQDELEMVNSMKEVFTGHEQIFHVDEEEEQVSDEEWNVSSDSEGEDVVEFIPQFDGTHPESKSRKQNKRITIESVNIGDFVYMRAPKNSKPYIACILDKNNEKKTIQVRWFYRPEETKTGARDWTGISEIFLISQSDTNPFETVVGKCKVLVVDDYFKNMPPNVQMPPSLYDETGLPEEFTDHNEDTFFCRFEYSVRKDEYKPLSPESKQILQNYERKVLLPAKKRKVFFADEEQPVETEVTPQSTNDNFFFDNFFNQAKQLPQNTPLQDIPVSTLMMEQALESFNPDRFNFAANSSYSSPLLNQSTPPPIDISPPPIEQEVKDDPSPPLASSIAKQVVSPCQSPIVIPTIADEDMQDEELLEQVFLNVELTPPIIDISPPSEKFEPSPTTTISNETSPPILTFKDAPEVKSGTLILDFKEPPSIQELENELHDSSIAYKGLIRQLESYPFFSSHEDYLESKRSTLIRFSSIFGKKKLNEEMPKSKHYKELPFLNSKSKPLTERPITQNFGKLILDFAPKPPSLSMVSEELSQQHKPIIADIEEIDRPLSPQYDEPIFNVASSLTAKKLLSLNNTPNTLRNRAPEYQSLLSELSVMTERKKIAFDEATKPVNNKKKKDLVSKQNLSVMCIECHILTRANFLPNPLYDSVQAIVISYQNCANIAESLENWLLVNREMEPDDAMQRPLVFPTHFDQVIEFKNEKDLYEGFIDLVCKVDPDILLGYEIQTEGFGYLIERGFLVMGRNICFEISRVANFQSEKKVDKKPTTTNNIQREKALKKAQEYARNKQSGVMIKGRVVMNVWRIMNGELKLDMYTLHNVVFNVLGRRIPFYSHQTMTDLSHSCSHEKDTFEYRVILQYYLIKTSVTLEILNHLDILNRTGELGKVYGIEFFSVISRGSQYRVESMMLRLARLRNYVALSPTRKQVMEQAAIECLPLVMEPQSKLYTNPMIVLDFQSLYPSIIIAYNLCYSTCLGKLAFVDRKKTKLGTLENYEPNNELRKLLKDRTEGSDSIEEDIFITPNQCLFVKPSVRQGVLPRMCSEILNTRIMVKQAMKETSKDDKETQRILNARQLGLKLIANVTYGYTSANFSGRMPLSDLADAIVQLARATLENAIDVVNEKFPGKCRIAYGDTDSLFVECVNSTREEAFKLGKEIVKYVTNANPRPVTLQMERVFHPSYLVSKKRYVGMAYESPTQTKGTLFSKGIESVRRDNCLMVRSLMEKSLEILFESLDFSRVKAYLSRQFYRIISEKCSLQDFVFWKKVKLGYYKSERHLPPSARIAVREMQRDPRAEPRFNERVPYVVVFSSLNPAKAKLSDMVIHPKYFIEDRMSQVQNYKQKYRLHYNYYITRQLLPSIDRLFSLSFVNCNVWYTNLPKKDIYLLADWRKQVFRKSKNFIEQYFQPLSRPCSSCGKIIENSKKDVTVDLLCSDCIAYPIILLSRRRATEKRLNELKELCRYCNHSLDLTNGLLPNASFSMEQKCLSLECPILYSKMQSFNNLQSLMEIKLEQIE